MLENLVTYHIYTAPPLPANDALAYQYILAGNGVFVRAETALWEARFPIASCLVRGLPPLSPHFHLKVPRLPAYLLDAILADARCARQPDGNLNEVLYQFHHHGRFVQVKKPRQQATAFRVTAAGPDTAVFCELHSHGRMAAFFSQTDDADEQGICLYGVIGQLDSTPEMQLRVGVCGCWWPLPLTAVFTDSGPFIDIYLKEKES